MTCEKLKEIGFQLSLESFMSANFFKMMGTVVAYILLTWEKDDEAAVSPCTIVMEEERLLERILLQLGTSVIRRIYNRHHKNLSLSIKNF